MLKPEYSIKSIYDINYGNFTNLKVILFDIDNTLLAHYSDEPDENVKKYINNLKDLGYQVYLCSNGATKRIYTIAGILNIKYLERAKKPSTKILKKFMNNMELEKDEVLIVGDQIFTDILCGNRAGIHTVLVEPISKEEPWFIKIKRVLEVLVKMTIKK